MRKRHTNPIPRSFAGHPAADDLLVETDVSVRGPTGRPGRLRMKLLIFRTKAGLRRFAKQALDWSLDGETLGVVNDLGWSIEQDGTKVARGVDPRYFAVMALVHGHLSMEIVTHESVHAGFFFSRRSSIRWPYQEVQADEAVCYPAGRIARAVNAFLHDNQLYGDRLPERHRRKP